MRDGPGDAPAPAPAPAALAAGAGREATPPAAEPTRSWAGLAARLALRAALRPRLALDLLRTAWAFRRRRWWASPPYLPLPDRTYLRWRMHTAYGDEDAVPPLEDVVRFARWRRETMGL